MSTFYDPLDNLPAGLEHLSVRSCNMPTLRAARDAGKLPVNLVVTDNN